ncbi:MAG: translation elongation factor-like protein [Minisyncoccia bacterium]
MEKLIGKVNHYFNKISVAIVELVDNIRVGNKIKIKDKDREIEQEVTSLQVDHQNVQEAKKGEMVGMKVEGKVKEGDEVYLITE